jgi:zinc transporter ZupT
MAFTNFAIDLKNEGNLIMSHPSVVSSPLTPETPESIASSTHAMIFATRSTATLVPGEYQGLSIPDKGGYSNHKTFHSNPASVRFIQGLVIIIAFSAHSIFDGVAIGLQEESTRIWTMFFAICSHKLVVALAVGKFILLFHSFVAILSLSIVSLFPRFMFNSRESEKTDHTLFCRN